MSEKLKPGSWLHASCSDEWYEVTRVGKDGNGTDVIDVVVPDLNEFIECDRFGDFQKGECMPSLMRVETAGPVKFVNLQWRPFPHPTMGDDDRKLIECNTPGDGCYRCTMLFSVHERKDR